MLKINTYLNFMLQTVILPENSIIKILNILNDC